MFVHRHHLGGGGGGGGGGLQGHRPPTFPHYVTSNPTLLFPAIPEIQYCCVQSILKVEICTVPRFVRPEWTRIDV